MNPSRLKLAMAMLVGIPALMFVLFLVWLAVMPQVSGQERPAFRDKAAVVSALAGRSPVAAAFIEGELGLTQAQLDTLETTLCTPTAEEELCRRVLELYPQSSVGMVF